MSNNLEQNTQPQPIPFSSVPLDQMPPSMNNFPSNSELNQALPQQQSLASINYNEEPNYNQLASQRSLQQQEQVEELQKVSLQKNEIDQDEILRMFREEEDKMETHKRQTDKRKHHSHQVASTHKDRKTLPHHSSKKQQQQTGQEISNHRRRQQTDQNPLPFVAKTSSFKDLKTPQPTTAYNTILTSQIIRQLLLQYKIQYRSSVYDPDWQKQRYKLKEQLYEQLCLGVQQMKQKPQGLLTKQEIQLLEKIKEITQSMSKLPYNFGVFKYCRNLVIELDLELFIHFHQKTKQLLSKDYKSQYKLLLTNLKDPQNYELRKKLLTRNMDAESLKVANEIELLTEAKRNQIKSKQQKLLKQFSVDHERIMLKPEFENQKQEQRVSQSMKQEQKLENKDNKDVLAVPENQVQKASRQSQQGANKQEAFVEGSFCVSNLSSINKYVQESTLSQLEELLSQSQVQRMRNRLQEDLKGDCKERMLARFDSLIIGRL